MRGFALIFIIIFVFKCISATPYQGNDNALGQSGFGTGGVGDASRSDVYKPVETKGNQLDEQQQHKDNRASENKSTVIDTVNSELEGVFDQIIQTAKTVDNTADVVTAVTTVANVVRAILAVVGNVNGRVVCDNNSFCEISAYLEAAVEKLLADVNGVVVGVKKRCKNLDDDDVKILKWVIEAVVAIAGNTTNAVNSILERSVEVATGETNDRFKRSTETTTEKCGTETSLIGLQSALSQVAGSLTKATRSPTAGVAITTRACDLQNVLGSVTNSISSLLGGLGLTNINNLVTNLVGSTTGTVKGLLSGLLGTLNGVIGGVVGGVVGGVLKSLNGLTRGDFKVISQLTGSLSGVVKVLGKVVLSLNQVVAVVTTVIRNISAVTNTLKGILIKLGSSFKILPCGH